MKTLVLSFVLLASALTAGTVQCQPAQSTVVNDATAGFELFTCPGDPGATAARLVLSGSFQDNSSAGPDMSVLFRLTADGFADLECLAIGVTIGTQTLGACTVFGDWTSFPLGLAEFTAVVTGGAGSDPLPFNASASVRQETVVPEPGTLALGALGLMVVAASRKR